MQKLTKGTWQKNQKNLYMMTLKTKESIDLDTVMRIVRAYGRAYKRAVDLPGEQALVWNFRNGKVENVHSYLEECYLFSWYQAAVKSDIFET